MPINNIPGVGPTNADIATAVAAPSAATIAAAVAAPSAATIAAAVAAPSAATIATAVAAAVPTTAGITSIVQSNAGATLAQHQEFSAGNWAWLGRTVFNSTTGEYTISGLESYKKIRIHIVANQTTGAQDVFLRLNGATSGYGSSYGAWYGSTSGVTGQIVTNWSVMRLSDSASNQNTMVLAEIESPSGGHAIVTSENFINSGGAFSSQYNIGKGFHLSRSTTKVANITVAVGVGQAINGDAFGVSVWGMK